MPASVVYGGEQEKRKLISERGKTAHGPGNKQGDEEEGSYPQGWANRWSEDLEIAHQPGKSKDQRKPSGCATTQILSLQKTYKSQRRSGNWMDKELYEWHCPSRLSVSGVIFTLHRVAARSVSKHS